MTEPKNVATTASEIVPGLFHIKIDDDRIKSQSDGYARVVSGKVVLIDPLPLDPPALARLGRLEAIVLGTPSHQRSAWRYRREHHVKVYAPAGSEGLEESPDVSFKEGDPLPGGLKAIHAPGPREAHYAFHVAGRPGVLLCTDLWHVGRAGIEFLPDKYMGDPARARESARRLLKTDFDVLCFGHGDPVLKGGRRVAAEVVEKDAEARRGGA